MSTHRQALGHRGETLARRHLESQGYTILEANYRTRQGEIDLVAEQDEAVVFVEVRTLSGPGLGTPAESITRSKQAHLVAAAQQYLQEHDAFDRDWRIDLVSIQLARGGKPRLEVLKNAVEL